MVEALTSLMSRGALHVRLINVVLAVVVMEKLVDVNEVDCVWAVAAALLDPWLFRGAKDSASIFNSSVTVVPEGTQMRSPATKPSSTP